MISIFQIVSFNVKRGKRDGIIRHILERENWNWMKKLSYCVKDQSGIQRSWVNLNMNFRQFLGVNCAKNLRESGI